MGCLEFFFSFALNGYKEAPIDVFSRISFLANARYHFGQCKITSKLFMIYPLVICYIAIEHGPVEIVDLSIEHGGSFQFVICKRLPGRALGMIMEFAGIEDFQGAQSSKVGDPYGC